MIDNKTLATVNVLTELKTQVEAMARAIDRLATAVEKAGQVPPEPRPRSRGVEIRHP